MKKVLLWTGVIILAGLVWYLFIKPSDYIVRFETKTSPGPVNQMIKIWNNSLDNSGEVVQTNMTELAQTLKFNDSTHQYLWRIERLTDSTSWVKVYAKDPDHSLRNKIEIPFKETEFEKRTISTVKDFNEKLGEHLDKIRVTIIGEENIPEKYCAYLSIETSQLDKAGGMMRDYGYLSGELLKYQIELDGNPMVDITEWNIEKDSIKFDFCFPIKKTDSLPDLGEIKYKQIMPQKAIKAIYNGNYIFSDRAWYALLDYAKDEGIEVLNTPLEIFYNNPTIGADEENWQAEVYMPLMEQNE